MSISQVVTERVAEGSIYRFTVPTCWRVVYATDQRWRIGIVHEYADGYESICAHEAWRSPLAQSRNAATESLYRHWLEAHRHAPGAPDSERTRVREWHPRVDEIAEWVAAALVPLFLILGVGALFLR